ncbi:hypothetical protein K7432_012616 [Basidiobolus ranarum]|uniref:PAS domain-containing protein n=1 Tax=Basidiobolus ranarum TaxID=34480 RepID=A0ABR2WKH9_9FUNG
MSKTSFISIASVDSMRMIYLSESCEDVLGLSRQQWLGKNAEHWFHSEDRTGVYVIIKACIELQKIATLIYLRVLSNSGYVLMESSFNFCYDIIVSSNRLLREADYPELFGRTCLAEDIITVLNTQNIHILGNPKVFGPSMELGQVLSQTTSLPPNSPLEERVCIIVNHNIDSHPIDFCSKLATEILGSLPEELGGTSLFEYIYNEDLIEVQEELKMIAIEQSIGSKIEFTWITKTFQQVEVQAIISFTDDGLIFIVRILNENDFYLSIRETFK